MNIKALLKSLLLRKFTTGLLILQLAITLGLLINSVILAVDTNNKLAQDTGLDIDNTLIVSLHPTSGEYRNLDYYRSIVSQDLHQLNQLSGVESVSLMNQLPINTRGMLGNVYDLDDPEIVRRDIYLQDSKIFLTNEELSSTLALALLEGRFLTKDDQLDFGSNENGNVLITESLKKALYGEGSALGQETNNGRIVGVVKDIMLDPTLPIDKQYGVFGNRVMEFIFTGRYYLLKVIPGQVEAVRNKVSDTILAVQAERDIYRIMTMAEHMKRFYSHDKGLAELFLLLCGLMIFVTAISSYAYSQFHISRQKKYIGIRRALGARKKDILLYVLTENWLVYSIGCALGLVMALGFNILLSQYISLSKPDIMMFLLASAVIFIAGTIATLIPAIKTSNIPPVIATRTV
ncbi:ABC transporter permease [Colwellia sp. Bg11-28]|jgi:putative ABC transport system permease protein|uniref:ABC transporter permease n=1 Tax=Colwellia sp. Bg11-28 TaxID=2058305 RepID=UPI000C320F38|nr:FtsX-like permease family protein [Colwellia sp. Bg11-28]PKH86470.1 ABC transporter permease [Colwellia sp. Bg11-28]